MLCALFSPSQWLHYLARSPLVLIGHVLFIFLWIVIAKFYREPSCCPSMSMRLWHGNPLCWRNDLSVKESKGEIYCIVVGYSKCSLRAMWRCAVLPLFWGYKTTQFVLSRNWAGLRTAWRYWSLCSSDVASSVANISALGKALCIDNVCCMSWVRLKLDLRYIVCSHVTLLISCQFITFLASRLSRFYFYMLLCFRVTWNLFILLYFVG